MVGITSHMFHSYMRSGKDNPVSKALIDMYASNSFDNKLDSKFKKFFAGRAEQISRDKANLDSYAKAELDECIKFVNDFIKSNDDSVSAKFIKSNFDAISALSNCDEEYITNLSYYGNKLCDLYVFNRIDVDELRKRLDYLEELYDVYHTDFSEFDDACRDIAAFSAYSKDSNEKVGMNVFVRDFDFDSLIDNNDIQAVFGKSWAEYKADVLNEDLDAKNDFNNAITDDAIKCCDEFRGKPKSDVFDYLKNDWLSVESLVRDNIGFSDRFSEDESTKVLVSFYERVFQLRYHNTGELERMAFGEDSNFNTRESAIFSWDGKKDKSFKDFLDSVGYFEYNNERVAEEMQHLRTKFDPSDLKPDMQYAFEVLQPSESKNSSYTVDTLVKRLDAANIVNPDDIYKIEASGFDKSDAYGLSYFAERHIERSNSVESLVDAKPSLDEVYKKYLAVLSLKLEAEGYVDLSAVDVDKWFYDLNSTMMHPGDLQLFKSVDGRGPLLRIECSHMDGFDVKIDESISGKDGDFLPKYVDSIYASNPTSDDFKNDFGADLEYEKQNTYETDDSDEYDEYNKTLDDERRRRRQRAVELELLLGYPDNEDEKDNDSFGFGM